MLKRFIACILFLGIAPTTFFIVSTAKADNESPWITSKLNLQKQSDTQAIPTTLNGNITCSMEGVSTCSVGTEYGAAISGAVRMRDDKFHPVISYLDNRQRFIPVPNSDVGISYTSEPVFGLSLYFNQDFLLSASLIDGNSFGYPQKIYKITQSPEHRLEDATHHLLPADYSSISFSENGKWMVVSVPNVTMLRVNLETYEVLPFGSPYNYGLGLSPDPKTAITNDGHYAVVASKNFGDFKIYDLDSCGSFVPDIIAGPLKCQSRDLSSFMTSLVAGYDFVDQVKFMNDDAVGVYANYKLNNAPKTARFIISTNTIPTQYDYLTLGDSYISGEGAFDYVSGTDIKENKCHLSYLSYPYLIGLSLNYNSYQSVACSGATTNDITNQSDNYTGQADHKKISRSERSSDDIDSILNSFKPGYIDQMDFVDKYQPQAITISIIGNDVGMIGRLESCFDIGRLPHTCFSTYEDRLEFVHAVNSELPNLIETYNKLKEAGPPNMRIYAVGYPQMAMPNGNCGVNVRLNNDEIIFAEQAIDYLDTMIKVATARAGVFYTDAENALFGHRLCETSASQIAANGVTAGNDIPEKLGGPVGSESFHPNPLGYELLEKAVLDKTNDLTAPMPAPDLTVQLPSETNLEILNAPHSGRPINVSEYDQDLLNDVVEINQPTDLTASGLEHAVAPGTQFKAEIHSDAIDLGTFTAGSNGDISGQINIPKIIDPGYHSVHLYGEDINGQAIDIFKSIFIADSSASSTSSNNAKNPQNSLNATAVVNIGSISTASNAKPVDPEATGAEQLDQSPRLQSGVNNAPQVLAADTSKPTQKIESFVADPNGLRKNWPQIIGIALLVALISIIFWRHLPDYGE